MRYIFPADLTAYQKDRHQINWCSINSYKNQDLNTTLPILNLLLSQERISPTESISDGTTLELGNISYGILPINYQSINVDQSISSCSDYTSLTIDDCIEKLNLLKIKLPLPKKSIEYVMDHKFFAQKVPAKSIYAEDLQRYVDKITVVAIHDDVLKPEKEFNLIKMNNIINQIYSSLDSSINNIIPDITNYDLSYLTCSIDNNLIIQDNSIILYNEMDNILDYLSDFTNLFIDKTCSDNIDYTFMNHIVDGSDITAYLDQSSLSKIYNIGNIFDQSYILLNENVLGDITSFIKSYSVPIQTRVVLPNDIPRFFITELAESNNEYVSSINIDYGTYVFELLKYYYGFSDNVILCTMKLILAQLLRNVNENLLLVEINQFMENITGQSKTGSFTQTNAIKSNEQQLSMFLQDETGVILPVIYHNDHIDVTTDVTMGWEWTLENMYNLLNQINTVRIIYVFDFGYEGNLGMLPSSIIMGKDQMFTDTGYLSYFEIQNVLEY